MLRMRLSLKSDSAPELVDLEAMLASVQRQIQEEIDSNDLTDTNMVSRGNARVVLQNQPNPSRTGEAARMKLTSGDGTETTRFDASQIQGNSPSRQMLREEREAEFRNRTVNSRPVSSLSAKQADETGIVGFMTGSTRSLNQIQEQKVAEHGDIQSNLSRSSAALPISGNFLHHVQNKLDGDDRAACWTLPRNKKYEDGSQKQATAEAEKVKNEVQSASGQRKSMDSVPEAWKNYWSCEQSISSARASVMVYDDSLKKWVPSGSSSGLSKVHIYHHTQHNTFRVVGRKLHDHEVVINCGIVRGLKYNQATATFHQWRDSRQVYGLNFSCREDADCFARAMMHSLEVLANRTAGAPAPPAPPPAVNGHHPPATHYDEDMGYRTMTREDAAIIQQQHHNQQQQQNLQQQLQQQIQQQALQQQALQQQALQQQALQQQALQQQQQQQQQIHSQMAAVSLQQQQQSQQQVQQAQPVAVVGAVQTPPQPPPHGPGLNHSLPLQPATHNSHTHHRTSSAPMSAAMSLPPAPPPVPPHQNLAAHSAAPAPPPPTPPAAPPMSLQCGAPPPPPPPGATATVTSTGPPPPPPPPMAASSPAGAPATSLAAQLQHARLKKAAPSSNKQPLPQENSGSSTSSGGSAGKATTPTPAPPTPMHSMMNEMARTLARRRAQVDRSEEGGQEPLKTWEKSATLPHRLGGAAASNGNGASSGSLAAGNSSNGGAPAPPPPPNCSDADNKARRRMASASEETILKQINGSGEGVCVGPGDWEAFKQEVLREVRAQVCAIKQEIIDAVKMELARR